MGKKKIQIRRAKKFEMKDQEKNEEQDNSSFDKFKYSNQITFIIN